MAGKILDICFHTTMVLTQRFILLRSAIACTSFHTTMVLTQLGNALSEEGRIRVSIPLWFSRNPPEPKGPEALLLFPYHYGSHATD